MITEAQLHDYNQALDNFMQLVGIRARAEVDGLKESFIQASKDVYLFQVHRQIDVKRSHSRRVWRKYGKGRAS